MNMLCPNTKCAGCATGGSSGGLARTTSVKRVQRLASDLPETPLSKHLEQHLVDTVFNKDGRKQTVTIRLVSNVEREQYLPPTMVERYGNTEALVHSQKLVMAFLRNEDGRDVAFFGMQVLEYDPDTCILAQYRKVAYVAYIESIPLFHLPGCNANCAGGGDIDAPCSSPKQCNGLRSKITREIFLAYLAHLQRRKFRRIHLWAMAPESHDSDYLFHMRPREQRLPEQAALERWYKERIKTARQRGIVGAAEDNTDRKSSSVLFHTDSKSSGDSDAKTASKKRTSSTMSPPAASKRAKSSTGDADRLDDVILAKQMQLEETRRGARERRPRQAYDPKAEAERPQLDTGRGNYAIEHFCTVQFL